MLQKVSLLEPTFSTSEELPSQNLEAVGPRLIGAGRPSWACGQARPTSSDRLSLGSTCHFQVSGLCLKSVTYSGGPSNLCEATYSALIGRNLMPQIMPHHLT